MNIQWPRVDFEPDLFETFLDNKGYDLVHYRSLLCPCLDSSTGQPSPNCTLCENGYQYWGAETIKGVISGVSKEKQYSESGGLYLGTINLTVKPTVSLFYHDRIVHVDSLIPYSQIVVRGESGSSDRLRYTPVTMERVTAIVSGAAVTYTETTDYTVSGRNLTWVTGRGPTVGASFSATYQHHPVWLVLQHSHMIRDTHVGPSVAAEVFRPMLVQALCKLEFLVEP